MTTPTIEYILSECCNANTDLNEYEKEICTRCGKECEVICYQEPYYNELERDDEKLESANQDNK